MDAWAVESRPGARDGLVVFVNLRPGDPRHGSAALHAGARHVDDGRLSADRLQSIYDTSMQLRLAAGDLAGGIAAGLDEAQRDLETAPEPAPKAAAGPALADFDRLPLNSLALLIAPVGLAVTGLTWRRHGPVSAPATLARPRDEATPAVAGALARGRLRPQLPAASLLDLARRGAIRNRTHGAGARTVRIHLVDPNRPVTGSSWSGEGDGGGGAGAGGASGGGSF
jgi:uncharacterized membrane protein YgcG